MTAGAHVRVTHEPERQRFAIALAEGSAVLEYRAIDSVTLDYYHTFVPPALRGRDVASELTAFALRYALDRRLKVVPTCPFVAAFINGHPEFAAVLAG